MEWQTWSLQISLEVCRYIQHAQARDGPCLADLAVQCMLLVPQDSYVDSVRTMSVTTQCVVIITLDFWALGIVHKCNLVSGLCRGMWWVLYLLALPWIGQIPLQASGWWIQVQATFQGHSATQYHSSSITIGGSIMWIGNHTTKLMNQAQAAGHVQWQLNHFAME